MNFKILTALALLECTSGALSGGEYDKELTEIKAGTRVEAKASWWGFNKDDATQTLQNAINSGVKKLIVDNTGSEWVIKPIKLASDQEILFEKGVVLMAKKNAFKGLTDTLFSAIGKKNIVLKGEEGVILKMRKADYRDPTHYKPSEWRHTVSLYSCENVTIQNLTLLSSGGDGIYIGSQGRNPMNYCKNILIDKVVCDDHNRQGITVISAENLTIRNSVLKNTHGAPPQDGIDFEPNNQSERVINCVIENCSITGNSGDGIEFRVKTDLPVSVSIRNCDINGNNRGIRYVTYVNARKILSEKDNIEVSNCTIGDSTVMNVDIQTENTIFLFKNCTIKNLANRSSAISLVERYNHSEEGIVKFENVTVIDNTPEHVPLSIWTFLAQPKLKTEGSINFMQADMVLKRIDCSKKVEPAYIGDFKLAAPIELSQLIAPNIPESSPGKSMVNSKISVRYQAKFIQFAEKGRKLLFEARGIKVGRRAKNISMRLVSPKGIEEMKFDLEPLCNWNNLTDNVSWKSIEFTPNETGIYTIECVKNNGNAFQVRSMVPGNGYLVEGEFHMICPKGKLFFRVPAGVNDIKIEVYGGEPPSEYLSASLFDPKGLVVCRLANVTVPKLLSFKRDDSSKAEIWAIEFSNAADDAHIRMGEGLMPIVSERPEYLPVFQ